MKRFLSRDIPPGAAITVVSLVLVASVVTGNVPEAPQAVVEPAARPEAPRPEPAPAVELDVEQLKRARPETPRSNLFEAPRPPVVAVAKPVAVAPPPPSAPPLPFRYVGRMLDGETLTLFLSKGADTLSVRVGETLDGAWRVDSATDTAIAFRYLPLDLPQNLAIPAP